MGILVGHYIGEPSPLGGLRPMPEAIVKGLQKVLGKLRGALAQAFALTLRDCLGHGGAAVEGGFDAGADAPVAAGADAEAGVP